MATGMAENFPEVPELNEDCWRQTLDRMEIQEMLRYRELSPRWKDMVDRYLPGVYGYAMFMPVSAVVAADKRFRVLRLTSASHVRLMLESFREHLTRLATDGDDRWLAEMAGNCPNLREITLYHTFWNKELLELLRSCERLEKVTLRGTIWVEDNFNWNLNNITHIEVDRNERITGSFLAHIRRPLESLALRACSALQGYLLNRHVGNISSLTRLQLDECSPDMLVTAQTLLDELPRLRELSLSHYIDARGKVEGLAETISALPDLRKLRLRKNDAINDRFLKTLAHCCRRLDTLDVSRCNGTDFFKGVTDLGLAEIVRGRPLMELDVSFLEGLTDQFLTGLHDCRHLERLRATHLNQIEQKTFYFCLLNCKSLQLLDIRGCDDVSHRLVQKVAEEMALQPSRHLTLLVAGTSFYQDESMKWPKNLSVSLDWPLDDPWERYYGNPDPENQVFEHYVDMDLDD